jgi:CBS domain-containing protein
MQVKDIMSRNVEIASPDTLLTDAAEWMRGHDIGILPVCKDGKLVGVVTDRDITIRATANKLDLNLARCQDVMTPEVISCVEDQEIKDAGTLMQDHKIRRLPVIDHQQRLVGIVSLGDIALGTGDTKLTGVSLQQVSTSDAPKPLPGQKRE